MVKDVGVMKDEELKLEEIEASHTLGGVWWQMDLYACVSEYYSGFLSFIIKRKNERYREKTRDTEKREIQILLFIMNCSSDS